MKKRILFIINPVAGVHTKDKIPYSIDRSLDKNQFDYEIIYTNGRGHATELATGAINKYQIIVIAGGDGSVNEVATSLVGSDIALAIIPSGSGNGLARHLGYSINIRSTLNIINQYTVKKIDVCKINDAYFFSIAGIGFDAYVAKIFSHEETRGFITYAWSALKSVFSFEGFDFELHSENKKINGKTFMINICNSNQYGYNVKVAPDASLFDGLMDVILINDVSKWKLPVLVTQLLTRQHLKSNNITFFKTSKLQIKSPAYCYLQIDGETMPKEKEFDISILPQCLNVLVNSKKQHVEKEQRQIRGGVFNQP